MMTKDYFVKVIITLPHMRLLIQYENFNKQVVEVNKYCMSAILLSSFFMNIGCCFIIIFLLT